MTTHYPKTRSEAKRLGAPFYYTGEPCKRGHYAPRLTDTKHCYECKATYPKRRWSNRNKPKQAPDWRENIAERSMPEPNSGCWIWLGEIAKGYGRARVAGKRVSAHRLSFEVHVGPIPSGCIICHSCDTPLCVNPAHLFAGTPADNVRDMVSKGRYDVNGNRQRYLERNGSFSPRGRKSKTSKLQEQEVFQINALLSAGYTDREIAGRYGVAPRTIYHIRHRTNWSRTLSEI